MNFPAIFRVLAWMICVLTLSFCVCGLCDACTSTHGCIHRGWVHTIEISAISTIILFISSRHRSLSFFRREALSCVGLGWILVCLLGSLPYILITQCTFVDAFFESTSGITTTGVSIFSFPEDLPKSILLWRAISQWIGGLGIATLFLAMTLPMQVSSKKIFTNESSGNINEFDSSKVQYTALTIFKIYVLLTMLCFCSLYMCGMCGFDALCHTLSTVSTGGFSTHASGIVYFQSNAIIAVVVCFMLLSSVNFSAYILLSSGAYKKLHDHDEMKCFISIIVCVSILISILRIRCTLPGDDVCNCLKESIFHVISCISSTGYVINDYTYFSLSYWMVLLLLLFIGGCTGSTSGGLKVARMVIIAKSLRAEMIHIFRPKYIKSIVFNGRQLDNNDSETNNIFCILYILFVCLFLFLFLYFEPGCELLTSIFSVISFFSNAGMIPFDLDVINLHTCTKMISSFVMILGRVEIYAILLMLVPTFWRRYQ